MKAMILCVSLTACWLVIAAPGATPASPTPPAPQTVLRPAPQPLQGVWRQVDANGRYLPSGLTLAFDGTILTMCRDSGETDVVRFSTQSNSIELELPEGRLSGAFELSAGTLHLALAETQGDFRRVPTQLPPQ